MVLPYNCCIMRCASSKTRYGFPLPWGCTCLDRMGIYLFFLPKKKATIPLVIGLSLLFPALYVLISQSGAVDGVIVYGKNFSSGREIIWSEFFKVFIHHPITGIGSNFDLMLPNLLPQILRATHHALLDLLFVHGVPVF